LRSGLRHDAGRFHFPAAPCDAHPGREDPVTTAAPVPRIEAGTSAVVLAPMEGVTDAVMRALLSEIGGFTFCVSEFLRIQHTIPGPRILRRHVPELAHGCRTPAGLPVQVQFLGGAPDRLAEAAVSAVRAGARAIDLNFGCPARTVNRHDGGATLLRYPERIGAIVAAVRAAVPAHLPVSAKLRLGWDDMRAIHVNAERAAEGGASWITIHARTKAQGYRPPAYWKPIGEVRARLGIPVVANGEIWTIDDLRRCRDETGCRHFMLGRGAVADPTLAHAAAQELGVPGAGPRRVFARTPAEWLPLLERFVELSAAFGVVFGCPVARLKQWLRMANHDGCLTWFDALKTLECTAEFLARLRELAAVAALPQPAVA
jgi:tRNA-dihydrouridine synthase C